ncbi:hypothetical protein BJ912DRAFT_932893 [Pholiota molesta]|nr:hypothetical protein BJ912DRAFT_932893 [Pholiota molesta]
MLSIEERLLGSALELAVGAGVGAEDQYMDGGSVDEGGRAGASALTSCILVSVTKKTKSGQTTTYFALDGLWRRYCCNDAMAWASVLWMPIWPVVRRDGWRRINALYDVHANRISGKSGHDYLRTMAPSLVTRSTPHFRSGTNTDLHTDHPESAIPLDTAPNFIPSFDNESERYTLHKTYLNESNNARKMTAQLLADKSFAYPRRSFPH